MKGWFCCVHLMNLLNQPTVSLPDLLFFDNYMPQKNRQQCLWEIKQTSRLSALPVTIFSLTVSPMLVDKFYAIGVLYYIQKPNSFGQLTQIIDHVLRLTGEKKWVKGTGQDFIIGSIKRRYTVRR